jgi:hypothetical protein
MIGDGGDANRDVVKFISGKATVGAALDKTAVQISLHETAALSWSRWLETTSLQTKLHFSFVGSSVDRLSPQSS